MNGGGFRGDSEAALRRFFDVGVVGGSGTANSTLALGGFSEGAESTMFLGDVLRFLVVGLGGALVLDLCFVSGSFGSGAAEAVEVDMRFNGLITDGDKLPPLQIL